jgi:heme/copper-type cytochrome/quinol oxidase subunit 2
MLDRPLLAQSPVRRLFPPGMLVAAGTVEATAEIGGWQCREAHMIRHPLLCAGALAAGLLDGAAVAVQQTPHHEFSVTARRYSFEPASLIVHQGDIVRITLHAEDIPHSFAIDAYRIAKKALPGRAVTFEFFADRPGTFTFYCNLTSDERCREMHGQLVVQPEAPSQNP